MKISSLLTLAAALVVCGAPAMADNPTTSVTIGYDGLPDTGTYFITNVKNGEALQPAAGTVGQNVFTQEFNKSGMQKWVVTRKIDPKTQKPLNRYAIRLAGDSAGLIFQPHPSVSDATAIISSDASGYSLDKSNGNYVVKSAARNGDALYIFPSPPSNTEARFGPTDSSDNFRWSFIKTD